MSNRQRSYLSHKLWGKLRAIGGSNIEIEKDPLGSLYDVNKHGLIVEGEFYVLRDGGGTMKGSPRSNPDKWEYKPWQSEDMPPKLIGQFDPNVSVSTNQMKYGPVKGYKHYR